MLVTSLVHNLSLFTKSAQILFPGTQEEIATEGNILLHSFYPLYLGTETLRFLSCLLFSQTELCFLQPFCLFITVGILGLRCITETVLFHSFPQTVLCLLSLKL